MATIPATITVNFTANYSGPHRVCWRIGNSGPYNCTTIVNCVGGGNPCSATITVAVDNETCNDVVFNGYVQAACEVEGSTNGRVPFSTTFTPSPACKGYTITCSAVTVASIDITDVGEGYDPNNPPLLTISGGGGTGATAIITIGNGGAKTLSITNGGSGYASGGNGSYTYVPTTIVSSSGSGAIVDVAVSAGVVTAIQINGSNRGTGYAVGDTISVSNTNLGGSGSGLVISITAVDTGEIESVTITDVGSGYTSTPMVTIEPPPGSPGLTATGTAVMSTCNDFNPGNNCDSTSKPVLTGFEVGSSVVSCSASAPTPGQGFTVDQDACCYDCVSITVSKAGGNPSADFYYTTCSTRVMHKVTVTGGTTITQCVVNNSWYAVENGGVTTITVGGPCS